MLCCFFHVYKLGRKNTRVSFVTIASIVMMWNLWVIKTNILRDNHMTHEAKKPQDKLSLKQKAKLETIARIKALTKGNHKAQLFQFISETGRHYKGRKIKLQEFFQNRIENFKQVTWYYTLVQFSRCVRASRTQRQGIVPRLACSVWRPGRSWWCAGWLWWKMHSAINQDSETRLDHPRQPTDQDDGQPAGCKWNTGTTENIRPMTVTIVMTILW